jgi:hypothetical protein
VGVESSTGSAGVELSVTLELGLNTPRYSPSPQCHSSQSVDFCLNDLNYNTSGVSSGL